MARCLPLSLSFAVLLSVVAQAGETPTAVTDVKAKPMATVSDAPVTVTQLQDLNKASKAQLEAMKKYAEARRDAQAASQSLVRIANAIAAKAAWQQKLTSSRSTKRNQNWRQPSRVPRSCVRT